MPPSRGSWWLASFLRSGHGPKYLAFALLAALSLYLNLYRNSPSLPTKSRDQQRSFGWGRLSASNAVWVGNRLDTAGALRDGRPEGWAPPPPPPEGEAAPYSAADWYVDALNANSPPANASQPPTVHTVNWLRNIVLEALREEDPFETKLLLTLVDEGPARCWRPTDKLSSPKPGAPKRHFRCSHLVKGILVEMRNAARVKGGEKLLETYPGLSLFMGSAAAHHAASRATKIDGNETVQSNSTEADLFVPDDETETDNLTSISIPSDIVSNPNASDVWNYTNRASIFAASVDTEQGSLSPDEQADTTASSARSAAIPPQSHHVPLHKSPYASTSSTYTDNPAAHKPAHAATHSALGKPSSGSHHFSSSTSHGELGKAPIPTRGLLPSVGSVPGDMVSIRSSDGVTRGVPSVGTSISAPYKDFSAAHLDHARAGWRSSGGGSAQQAGVAHNWVPGIRSSSLPASARAKPNAGAAQGSEGQGAGKPASGHGHAHAAAKDGAHKSTETASITGSDLVSDLQKMMRALSEGERRLAELGVQVNRPAPRTGQPLRGGRVGSSISRIQEEGAVAVVDKIVDTDPFDSVGQ